MRKSAIGSNTLFHKGMRARGGEGGRVEEMDGAVERAERVEPRLRGDKRFGRITERRGTARENRSEREE